MVEEGDERQPVDDGVVHTKRVSRTPWGGHYVAASQRPAGHDTLQPWTTCSLAPRPWAFTAWSVADLLGDYPAVRYYPPSGDLYFDVMTRLGELADFDSVAQESREVDGIRVRVATPAALYQLKKDTVRPLDRQDAEALRRRFDLKQE